MAVPTINTTAISTLKAWKLTLEAGSSIDISIVWIQGKIDDVWLEEEGVISFILNDGTGVAEVVKCSNVPTGSLDFSTGKYVMVVGEVLQIEPKPRIKAMKIQDLTNDSNAASMWEFEVVDMYKFGQ